MANKDLERLMRVTSFRSWIVLCSLAALLAGVVMWSIFGSLPERIEGNGVLQTEAGTQQITAGGEGILVALKLKPGDQVTAGQIVGQLRAVHATEASRAARARYDEEVRRHAQLEQSEQGIIANLQVELKRKRALVKERETELARQRDNLAKQTVAQSAVETAKFDLDRAISEVTDADMRIRARQETISTSRANVEDARISFTRTLGTAKEVQQVKSSVTGKVTYMHRKPGDAVFTGQPIAEVQSTAGGTALEVVAYIPARNGKRVLPGQLARLSVAGLAPEEFGYLQGEVKSVSDYPVSAELAQRVLKEEAVRESSYEVRIRPVASAESPARYTWIAGPGKDEHVRAGTTVLVSVQVSERRPITLVLPLNREDRLPVADRSSGTARGSSN